MRGVTMTMVLMVGLRMLAAYLSASCATGNPGQGATSVGWRGGGGCDCECVVVMFGFRPLRAPFLHRLPSFYTLTPSLPVSRAGAGARRPLL